MSADLQRVVRYVHTCTGGRSQCDLRTEGLVVRLDVVASRQWPDVPAEQQWARELMEERLERTGQTPEELSGRAEELRVLAADAEIEGFRTAALALAERYDEAAQARLASA